MSSLSPVRTTWRLVPGLGAARGAAALWPRGRGRAVGAPGEPGAPGRSRRSRRPARPARPLGGAWAAPGVAPSRRRSEPAEPGAGAAAGGRRAALDQQHPSGVARRPSPVIPTDSAAGLLAETSRSAWPPVLTMLIEQRRRAAARVDRRRPWPRSPNSMCASRTTIWPTPALAPDHGRDLAAGLGDLAGAAAGERDGAEHGAGGDDGPGRAKALGAAHVVVLPRRGASSPPCMSAERQHGVAGPCDTRGAPGLVASAGQSLVANRPRWRRARRRHVCRRVVNPLTCNDRPGRAAAPGAGVLTLSQRKGQRTHGFQGRRDRCLPAPRCRSHRGHRDSDDQGRGARVPRPEGRAG